MKMWQAIALILAVFSRTYGTYVPDFCPVPPTLAFADRNNEIGIQQDFVVGRKVIYKCLPGYTWNSSTPNFVICQDNFTWSEPLISCTPVDCKNPKDIQHGYYTATGQTYGSRAIYYCDEGYQLFGKRDILCTTKGWSKHTPNCDEITCDPLGPIDNGNVTQGDEWTYGMEATFSCHAGYTLRGQRTTSCTDTGDWSHEAPFCQEVVCDPPGPVNNGSVTQRDRWTYGMEATFSCHDGYTLIGQRTINCTDAGNWNHTAPFCQEIVCDPPGPINNGSVTQGDIWKYGMEATFSCHDGYTLIGQCTIICTDAGNWSHEAPFCQATTFSPIPDMTADANQESRLLPSYSYNSSNRHIAIGIIIVISTLLFILLIKCIHDKRRSGYYKMRNQFNQYHKDTEVATIVWEIETTII